MSDEPKYGWNSSASVINAVYKTFDPRPVTPIPLSEFIEAIRDALPGCEDADEVIERLMRRREAQKRKLCSKTSPQ